MDNIIIIQLLNIITIIMAIYIIAYQIFFFIFSIFKYLNHFNKNSLSFWKNVNDFRKTFIFHYNFDY